MALKMPTFLEDRYLETIGLLKDLDLWDLENGMKFLPIIQYCMPPPAFDEIYKLLKNLFNSGVNTSWAPSKVLSELMQKMRKVHDKKRSYLVETSRGDPKKYGTHYPISFGINKIANQNQWLKSDRASLIVKFVEIVYLTTAKQELLYSNTYYRNIFNLRDVLITDFHENTTALPPKGQFDSEIDIKANKVNYILNRFSLLGTNENTYGVLDKDRFWANPPEAKFTLPSGYNQDSDKNISNSDEKISIIGFEPGNFARPPQPEDFLLNNEQQKNNPYYSQPKWVRNNVRSLADTNQLTWSTIFGYWERVLRANKKDIFTLSLISLIAGIRKRRWMNATYEANKPLSTESMYISENNTLTLVINRAAHIFSSDEPYAKHFTILNIPKKLQVSKENVKAGLNEEGLARGFEANNPGVKPLLNNVARSGHTLLRKQIAGELNAFILAGDIPIEFKARNAYYQTNNLDVNLLLKKCMVELKSVFSKVEKHYPLTKLELNNIDFNDKAPVESHFLGSQLAKPNFNFSSFAIKPQLNNDHNLQIRLLNHLEVYYFWMLHYSYAIRPWGEETNHSYGNDFLLHKDKNSSDYIEAKLICVNSLVKEQKKELDKFRSDIKKNHQVASSSLKVNNAEQPHFHVYEKGTKTLKSKPLLAKEAIDLTKKLWGGLKPVLGRSNAHRHQCASYIHKELGEAYADAWLGHHIDGWYFASPQSSSTINILNKLAETQQKWLEKNGFNLIRNPLS